MAQLSFSEAVGRETRLAGIEPLARRGERDHVAGASFIG